jgi:hypothetical protein
MKANDDISKKDKKEMPNTRTDITFYPTLLNTLEQSVEHGGVYRLWQNTGGTREYVDARLVRLNREQSQLFFVTVNEGDELKLKKGLEVFAHCEYRALLFRAHLLRASQDVVQMRFPEQLQIQDGRIEERENFGLCSEFFARVRYQDENGDQLESEVKILDRSENGLCLIVDKRLYKVLSRSKGMRVLNATCGGIESGAKFKLRNRSPMKGNSMSFPTYRLGFEKV